HPNRPLWLKAVSRGLSTEKPLPKREKNLFTPMTPQQEKLLTKLKTWRNKQADIEGVEPAMIVTSPVLKEIAQRGPTTLEALRSIPLLRQWQITRYGEQLIKELSKSPISSGD